MALKPYIARVVSRSDLSEDEMFAAMNTIMEGRATDAQIGALLTGLRLKGETVGEITGAARAMRSKVARVDHSFASLLDTCGTGGDGSGTFNISTAVGFVCAGAGVRVAKHGNRAISSRSGSADVLEAMGVNIELPLDRVHQCLADVGFAFLFAPAHHPAMKHVGRQRRELGIRTIMNLLGPVTNPAGATHQLVGIYDRSRVCQVAEVLGRLGAQCAIVAHGHDGLDEISPCGPTDVAEWRNGHVITRTIEPQDIGLDPVSAKDIAGGDSTENAAIVGAVLSGEQGAPRTAVLLNAAWALYASEAAETPAQGLSLAQHAIDSGAAQQVVERLIAFSTGS